MNPVELLKYLLDEENIPQSRLAQELGKSRQLVTDILKYRRGFSRSVVLKLSDYFSMSGSISSLVLSFPRVLFAASKDNVLPIKILSKVHSE